MAASQRQPRIVVVTRQTRLEGLLRRWSTRGQARFAFRKARAVHALKAGADDDPLAAEEEADLDFLDLDEENTTYHEAIQRLSRELDFGLPVQVVDRQYLPSIDFEMCTVVVVIGQDGLVANTAKYVGNVPIVGVNPDPARFDGVLLPYHLDHARDAVSRVLNQRALTTDITLAEATLHDGQRLLAFNDFFVGANSHVSARYEIRVGEQTEPQSSSGILVATGAGSTGWMSSVVNMTCGIARWMGNDVGDTGRLRLDWSDRALVWAVREPFLSQQSGASLVAGRIDAGQELIVESRMATGGVIFSDGIEADFLAFNGGTIARIGVADQRARLVVPTHRRPPHAGR
jgi:hypothetical protein